MNEDNTNHDNMDQMDMQAKHIASMLDAKARHLSMRTLAQLEEGRNKALKRHKERQGASFNTDGTLSHWVGWAGHQRLAMVGLALVVILGAFITLQMFHSNETSDAFLLGSVLPPEAFVDQGFEPSLNRTNI